MEDIKDYIKVKKDALRKQIMAMDKEPHITILQVGHVPASDRYVKNKLKDCADVNLPCSLLCLPETITEAELLELIDSFNNDPEIDGFIVQLPLPDRINPDKVKMAICKEKDIDGFNCLNKVCYAATPSGIVTYLEDQGYKFEGKNAVIIGRSCIVGKPMHKLLVKRNMNAIMLHSHTSDDDKRYYLRNADLVVVATGHPHTLTAEYELKPDALVFDVGINVQEDGKLCGDCDKDLPVAFQSPVPGGVGLLTRMQLIDNLLKLVKSRKRGASK